MHPTTHTRESSFHDQWAASADVDRVAVRAAFESPTALENRFILKQMGDLRGRRILDIGCGLGEASVYFALQGAEVTATDLSPGMIATTVALAKHHDVEINGLTGAAEELDLPENHFDFVYSANTLHHVTDRDAFLQHAYAALKPGGRIFTWDPLAYNPVINVYRRMATQVRTPDEQPLTFRDLGLFRKYFVRVRHREFWILTLSLFLKYYLLDHVHPNAERYWKKIYDETPSKLWWWRPLLWIDHGLTRAPLARRLAWNMVVWAEKARGRDVIHT